MSKPSTQDIREFKEYLANCTDAQVAGVYAREMKAEHYTYANLALDERNRRALKDSEGWA